MKDFTRKEVVAGLEYLVNLAKNLPIFNIAYTVKANNEDIIIHMVDTANICDWDGHILDGEYTKSTIKRDLTTFFKSKFYHKEGKSELVFTKHVRADEISFNFVKELMHNVPIGEFGEFLDYNETVEYFMQLES